MIPISYPSPRVSQLDAHILDSELFSLLKENLTSIFNLHTNKWWTYDQHPELWDLILNIVLFRLTLWKTGSSYGLSLQNLKLVNFKDGRKIGYTKRSLLLAVVIGDYLFSKIQSYLYASTDGGSGNFRIFNSIKAYIIRNKETVLSRVNNTFKILNLVNFLLFLLNGRYPSLVHRALGISLTPIVTDLLKFNGDNVNYEFQNRQLVWNVMTEFLVFIVPLLQLKKLSKMSQKLLSPYKDSQQQSQISPYQNLPISQCAVCYHNKEKALSSGEKKIGSVSCDVTNPYITNCGHIYCYICSASLLGSADSLGADGCLRCGTKLEWVRKYDEDIDVSSIVVEYEEVEESEDEQFNEKQSTEEDFEQQSDSDIESVVNYDDQEQVFDDGGDEAFDDDDFDDDFDQVL